MTLSTWPPGGGQANAGQRFAPLLKHGYPLIMQSGYLLIETRADHPQRVRLITQPSPPAQPPPGGLPEAPRLRYLAYFNDIEAALMQAHTALRRRLIDADSHLYRVECITAIAAVDTIPLNHRRLYLDPVLAGQPELAEQIAQRHTSHRRNDLIWQGVGLTAVAWLLLVLLLGL